MKDKLPFVLLYRSKVELGGGYRSLDPRGGKQLFMRGRIKDLTACGVKPSSAVARVMSEWQSLPQVQKNEMESIVEPAIRCNFPLLVSPSAAPPKESQPAPAESASALPGRCPRPCSQLQYKTRSCWTRLTPKIVFVH